MPKGTALFMILFQIVFKGSCYRPALQDQNQAEEHKKQERLPCRAVPEVAVAHPWHMLWYRHSAVSDPCVVLPADPHITSHGKSTEVHGWSKPQSTPAVTSIVPEQSEFGHRCFRPETLTGIDLILFLYLPRLSQCCVDPLLFFPRLNEAQVRVQNPLVSADKSLRGVCTKPEHNQLRGRSSWWEMAGLH